MLLCSPHVRPAASCQAASQPWSPSRDQGKPLSGRVTAVEPERVRQATAFTLPEELGEPGGLGHVAHRAAALRPGLPQRRTTGQGLRRTEIRCHTEVRSANQSVKRPQGVRGGPFLASCGSRRSWARVCVAVASVSSLMWHRCSPVSLGIQISLLRGHQSLD